MPSRMYRPAFLAMLLHALLRQQAANWRVTVRPGLRALIMVGALSQVWLIGDGFATLPAGTLAAAFAAPFDGWNLWLLYVAAIFGSAAVGYGFLADALMQSLRRRVA